jgi:hypothetical protein
LYKRFLILVLLLFLLFPAICSAQIPAGTWYKGDLHSHSIYSDGDSSVADVIANAEAKGLDFFALTDHDAYMSGTPLHWFDPAYHSDTLALFYGIEWTTPKGHANVWASAPFDYSQLWQANRDRDALAALSAAHALGALFSINHPEAIFTSNWDYPVYDGIDSIEVWNGMYRLPSVNRWAGHHFWDKLLKSGRRIPGVGGSDTHQVKRWQSRLLNHGNPTTWVFAQEKSAESILSGIKAGHASISYALDAPQLEFMADLNGDGMYDAMMGDNVGEISSNVSFRIAFVNHDNYVTANHGKIFELNNTVLRNIEAGRIKIDDILNLISLGLAVQKKDVYGLGVFKNGKLFKVWILVGTIEEIRFSDSPVPGTYYRIELIGKPDVTPFQQLLYGRVIALTNPIYFGFNE